MGIYTSQRYATNSNNNFVTKNGYTRIKAKQKVSNVAKSSEAEFHGIINKLLSLSDLHKAINHSNDTFHFLSFIVPSFLIPKPQQNCSQKKQKNHNEERQINTKPPLEGHE
jgi:hypothetical protein